MYKTTDKKDQVQQNIMFVFSKHTAVLDFCKASWVNFIVSLFNKFTG